MNPVQLGKTPEFCLKWNASTTRSNTEKNLKKAVNITGWWLNVVRRLSIERYNLQGDGLMAVLLALALAS